MESSTEIWQVYMLECKDGSYYTGITNNLGERLKAHSLGKGSKYVASRMPFCLIHSESQESKSDALKREHAIKRLSHKEKQLLIETFKLNQA